MIVLGIETATRVCGAAVAAEGRVLSDAWEESRNIHAERLMSLIERALETAGLNLGALDAIAVSEGPGSFTGLRVGVSAAKGLAFATGKPLAGVPTLLALAERAVRASVVPDGGLVVPLLDARREEIYYQLFRRENGAALPLGEPLAAQIPEFWAMLAERQVVLTGESAEAVLKRGPGGGSATAAASDVARCSAGMIAILGDTAVRAGNTVSAADLEPRYVKEFFLRAP